MGRTRKQEPISKDYADFGAKIRELRLAMNLTQKELAKHIGVSKTSMVNYETGTRKIPLTLIVKFSDFFNVSVDELLGFEKKNENDENNKNNKALGNNLKELRHDRHLSKEELSAEIGITTDNLVRYENGDNEIPLSVLVRFSKFFGVSMDQLVGLEMGDDMKFALVTSNKYMKDNFKKWEAEVGYNVKFSDEEIDKIIDYAKYILWQRDNK